MSTDAKAQSIAGITDHMLRYDVGDLAEGVKRLSAMRSLFVTRTSLQSYVATRDEYLARARDLLQWVTDGTLVPRIHAIVPLANADEAHRALESRASTGKLLLRCA